MLMVFLMFYRNSSSRWRLIRSVESVHWSRKGLRPTTCQKRPQYLPATNKEKKLTAQYATLQCHDHISPTLVYFSLFSKQEIGMQVWSSLMMPHYRDVQLACLLLGTNERWKICFRELSPRFVVGMLLSDITSLDGDKVTQLSECWYRLWLDDENRKLSGTPSEDDSWLPSEGLGSVWLCFQRWEKFQKLILKLVPTEPFPVNL